MIDDPNQFLFKLIAHIILYLPSTLLPYTTNVEEYLATHPELGTWIHIIARQEGYLLPHETTFYEILMSTPPEERGKVKVECGSGYGFSVIRSRAIGQPILDEDDKWRRKKLQ